MTTRPPMLRMLPGGQRTGPTLPLIEAEWPLEARMATDEWVEALSTTELIALIDHHVLLAIQTSPLGTLESLTWRKLADVLLSEMVRRLDTQSCADPRAPIAVPCPPRRNNGVLMIWCVVTLLLGGLLLLSLP